MSGGGGQPDPGGDDEGGWEGDGDDEEGEEEECEREEEFLGDDVHSHRRSRTRMREDSGRSRRRTARCEPRTPYLERSLSRQRSPESRRYRSGDRRRRYDSDSDSEDSAIFRAPRRKEAESIPCPWWPDVNTFTKWREMYLYKIWRQKWA